MVARDGSAQVERLKTSLQQVVHQQTHTLARLFSEIDGNYKQFKKGSELRKAASQRMEAQRAFYEEGRITIDHYLDAISQFAGAVSAEALYKTTYNTSIVALEEATGTLLEYERITVVAPPAPDQDPVPSVELPVVIEPSSLSPNMPAPSLNATVSPSTGIEQGRGPEANIVGKTFSFHVTVGRGPNPVEIRGTFTITPSNRSTP